MMEENIEIQNNVSDEEMTDLLSLSDFDTTDDNVNEIDNENKIGNQDNEIDYSSNKLPSLRDGYPPPEFKKLVDRVLNQYKLLPFLDYNEIYQELSDLSINSCPTPSLQVLNDEIQRVQAAKDRLSEIYISVVQCHNFKKRAVDILQDSWGKFTEEKNAEKRKGDGCYRLSNFIMDFAKAETLLKACNHIFKNLDSLHDSLSRRITIYQLTLKLQDIGRGALPDLDLERQGGRIDTNQTNEQMGEQMGEQTGEQTGEQEEWQLTELNELEEESF